MFLGCSRILEIFAADKRQIEVGRRIRRQERKRLLVLVPRFFIFALLKKHIAHLIVRPRRVVFQLLIFLTQPIEAGKDPAGIFLDLL